jgi:hypothetical protein
MTRYPRRNYFEITYRADAHRRARAERGRVREPWQTKRCFLTDTGMCKASSESACLCKNVAFMPLPMKEARP